MKISQSRLERLKPILACPSEGGNLHFTDHAAHCQVCGASYPIRRGKIYFVEAPPSSDSLDTVKGRLKSWLGQYYYTIGLNVLAPTYPFRYRGKIRQWLEPRRHIIIDVGCGNHRIDADIICLDLYDYDVVDVVCDLGALPFKPQSVDAFVSRSVLEHIPDPVRVVQHFYRCTRPGGLSLHLIPFLFPFHASPYDFQRYTHKGVELLFGDWEIVVRTNATGPITLGLISLIECLAIIGSLGQARGKAYLYLLFCALLFPLKYLDAPFVNRQSFLTLAPTIFLVARKRDASAVS
jgi:SAM-dependent methyltransferase